MMLTSCRTLLLPALTLTAAVGCGPEAGPVTTCRQAQGIIILNALTLNGLTMNGLSLEGTRPNAWNNGTELDGVEPVQGVVVDDVLESRLAIGAPVAGEQLLAVGVGGEEMPLTVAGEEERDGRRNLRVTLANGANPCGSKDAVGLLIPGVWDLETGDRHDTMRVGDHELRHTFSCTSGVIAKCVLWGYGTEAQGADVHETCTRLARADYCGDGVGYTENNTPIDVYDTLGILEPEGGMSFEAGWGPKGAVCVSHPRYLDVAGGAPIYPSCWNALPRCTDRETAEAHDALLVNASRMRERTWCSEADRRQ